MTIDEPYKGDWLSYIFSITYVDSLFLIFIYKLSNSNFEICLTFLPDEMTSVEY